MKEVAIEFIEFLKRSEGFLLGFLMASVICVLAICATVYQVEATRMENETRVKIIQTMTERGYTEVQTAGTTSTHWEKK